ncbi:PREDICTED: uncharacterized protein LOC105455524 isoform X2 [Wasmannia auropunctata]|uniref:uncharacterized protein LOC105455524 isoform X2 n=1 Tax=Wasmannia auropunctata TaxID=64793 RepID=UPI0005EF320B|nr:PREDICTED: uncharacterized protein LOC105455524 isoform X2 [Wasmannia auropunctata]
MMCIHVRCVGLVRACVITYLDRFPEDEDCWKKWLNAIGEANGDVLAQLSLCSRHFSQACSSGLILVDNAVPTSELAPTSFGSIAKATGTDRLSPQREPEVRRSSLLRSLPSSIKRPTITRGRRVHMLSKEEMKEMPPIKYVRYLKNVNWDEIWKVPEEAKIVWEVAMEELKEDNDKIKHLQAHVRQLSVTIQKLKNALKTRKSLRQCLPLSL